MDSWLHKKDPFSAREAKKYDRPIPSREFIIDFLAKKPNPLSHRQLVVAFQLDSDFEQEALRRRLRAMVRDGQLYKGRKGKYDIIRQSDLIQGRVVGHRDKFGFVSPEDGTADIYLSPEEMRSVFDGDLVAIRIVGYDQKNRREGHIIDIIERSNMPIVGRFFKESGVGFVESDNSRISQEIIIQAEDQHHAKHGQIVSVKIKQYPSAHALPIGEVIEVLGDYMAPGMEIEVAIRSNGLPHHWPPKVIKEVEKFSDKITENDMYGRVDLRSLPFVTIDGEDAQDFDDAVYCEPKEKGGWRLYVAIADVGHYVKPHTSLDEEAINRGNSVYFPGHVIPMLPRELSNGLCSLKPNVDRLSVVCDLSLSQEGGILRSKFYSAVIQSKARLTYDKVATFLKGKNPQALQHYQNLHGHIKNLERLFEVIHQYRAKRGVLDFEKDEIKVEFGAGRKIKKLIPVKRNKAHRIIEECMLCANIAAARFLTKHNLAALFRVHDGPNPEKLADLKVLLGEIGLHLGGGDLPTSLDYANVLEKIQGRPDAHLLQTALLRSLSRAFYSPENDGHFGLAFDEYTHFTSPIRRYPDLIVHRAIKTVANHQQEKQLPDFNHLIKLGEHFSMTERRADDATREALTWLKCEYMLDKVGEEFDGIITGVTGFGIFVELNDIYVEGLVHITAFSGDYFEYDAIHHRLIGTRTRKIYRIGDPLKIRVAHVNLENKQIDFELVGQAEKSQQPPKSKSKLKSKRDKPIS